MNVFLLATMLFGSLALPAHGQETRKVFVHGQTLVLPAPQGACFLDEKKDGKYFDFLSQHFGKNLLIIGTFVPCELLSQIRSGQIDYNSRNTISGSYMTLPNPASAFPAMSRKTFTEKVEQQFGSRGGSELNRALAEGKRKLENNPDFQIEDSINLGSLARDSSATYVATMFNVKYGSVRSVVININAVTLVKKMAVFLKIQEAFQDGRALDALKQTATRTANQLVRMNDP